MFNKSSSEEVVIRVEHVYKDFVLPHERVSSLKSAFTSIAKKKRKVQPTETQHALKDISFEIKKGEFFGIVGRNGSGKSTLLKILAGIYQPTKGSISTSGRLVPFIELGVGFNAELTGRENVYLNGAMLGFSEKEVEAMYDDIVTFAELERFMDQKLKNYSSGMQVRLAFSMATRAKAEILLVDEVLAVGDADFQRKCFEYFRSLKKNKKTVVFVSHDMGAVRQYCDRGILIDDSKLMLAGTSAEIAVKYAQLFSTDAEGVQTVAGQKRWGNQKAIISSASLAPKRMVDKQQPLTITVNIESKQAMENLVLGFSISNSRGEQILGTNTQLLKMNTGVWKAGDSKTVIWSTPNIFADGNYSVGLALVEEDIITVCDWWDEALSFKSFEAAPGPYITSPDISCELTRPKK